MQTCVDILSQKWFLPTLLPEIWVLRKILEFWRKNGLSFDQNVEKNVVFTSRREGLELTWLMRWNELKRVQTMGPYRYIIHQINQHAKPDFRVNVPDLYDRRCRRRRRKRVRRQHPGPQGPTYIDIIYIKMIPISSPTS